MDSSAKHWMPTSKPMAPTEKLLLTEVMMRQKLADDAIRMDKEGRWIVIRRALNDIPVLIDEIKRLRAEIKPHG